MAGALVLHRPGATGACMAGGPFGPIGGAMRCALVSLVGVPAAALACLVPLVHALRLFGRLESRTDRSWLVFLAGVVVLLPIMLALGVHAGAENDPRSGLWGAFTAFYLTKGFGSAGAWIVVALGVSALTAATLSWNPIRAIVGRAPTPAMPAGALVAGGIVEGEPEPPRRRRRSPRGLEIAAPGTVAALLEPPPEEMPAIDPTLAGAPLDAPVAATEESRAERG